MSRAENIAAALANHDSLIRDYRLDFDALVAVGADLLQEIEHKPVSEDALDDIVYDCAGEDGAAEANEYDDDEAQEEAISRAEARAMEINGGGPASQIAFILASCGVDEGGRIIREALGLPR